ncbi:hypothetical protein A35_00155 [Coxiella burnetii 'MSU Goat Q177']|nr:hypothetical protein A35_00155 [Coxiella burnetii 'MSU Goat Q177']
MALLFFEFPVFRFAPYGLQLESSPYGAKRNTGNSILHCTRNDLHFTESKLASRQAVKNSIMFFFGWEKNEVS